MVLSFCFYRNEGGESVEGVIGSNRNVDIVVNYIERNRLKIQETMKMLDTVSKKVCQPAIMLADKAKSKLEAVQTGLNDIDKKVITPVLDIADKAKDKIKDLRKGMLELDKKVLSPIIKITGGDNSKLKFLQDGLKSLDNKVFKPVVEIMDKTTARIKGVQKGLKAINNTIIKPAIELVDGTKTTIKAVKAGVDLISTNGVKVFDMVSKSANLFAGALDMAKVGTIQATLAQWGFNSAMFANPVTWIVLGVIALIAAIILLVRNWDKVKSTIVGFVTWFKSTFAAIGAWLSSNWKKVVTTVLLVMGPIGWAVLAIVRIIRTNWNSIKETVISVWNAVAGFFTGLWDGIKNTALTVWNSIGSFINSIGEAVRGVWNGIMEWFSQKFNWIKGFINEIVNNPVFQFISGGIKSVVDIGGKVVSGVTDWAFGKDEKQAGGVQKKVPGNPLVQKNHPDKTVQQNPVVSPVQQYKEINQSKKASKPVSGNDTPNTINITIPKLADSIVVHDKEDIDKLTKAIVAKLKQHSVNMGVA